MLCIVLGPNGFFIVGSAGSSAPFNYVESGRDWDLELLRC